MPPAAAAALAREAYAPGSAIVSDFLAGTTMSLSGTSMASPHVAGVAVLDKSTFGDAPSATVSSWIGTNATSGGDYREPGGHAESVAV